MDGIVMFSAGVESTALLEWLVREKKENVTALHSVYPNKTAQANIYRENVGKICEILDVPLIVHEHPTYESELPDVGENFHSSKHWILACCTAQLRYPYVKNFYWGVNSGINQYGDQGGDYHFLPRSWEFQLVFEFFGRMANGQDYDQKMYPPICGWTKKQMWEYISDDIKPYVTSCVTGDSCGKCNKCEEFSRIV